MKKVLFVLALTLFCTVSAQNALAKPTKAAKSRPAKAEKASLGLNALGGELGLVDPEGASSTIGFGAFADLGTIAPDFKLSTHLNYWSKSESQMGADASVRDISLGARVRYMFHVSSRKVQPYAGTGFGLHFFHTEAGIPGFRVSDSTTKLGLDLGGGVSTPVSPTADLFGDLWYTVADIDQFAMKVGVSFRLHD